MRAASLKREREIEQICGVLYKIAQRHTPASCFEDITELLNISKILPAHDMYLPVDAELQAATGEHSSAVLKQSAEYRLLSARFKAALSTIADLGSKQPKRAKNEFHAGVNEGLRRAAKIAIMFLGDLDSAELPEKLHEQCARKTTTETKSRCGFIR